MGEYYESYTGSLVLNEWVHAAFVLENPYDTSTDSLTVYKNGEAQGSPDTSFRSGTLAAVPGNLVLGRRRIDWDTGYSSVEIDELVIFDEVVSAGDISRIHDMSNPSPP